MHILLRAACKGGFISMIIDQDDFPNLTVAKLLSKRMPTVRYLPTLPDLSVHKFGFIAFTPPFQKKGKLSNGGYLVDLCVSCSYHREALIFFPWPLH